mmetsp:Transcript_111298/g.315065  ORF Transcript_111298/g.315065 Transcript_111298/m.315065 type:complete len:471 (+) Transcript_111298:30-1442(+)
MPPPWPRRCPPLLRWLAVTAGVCASGASPREYALRGARGAGGSAIMPSQVLVFDAGSSGTRVHVFNLSPLAIGSHVPKIDMSVRAAQTLKIKPGLSAFAKSRDLEGVGKNIEGLLQFADKFVPTELRRTTPAILKATAGLRAVPADAAEAVLGRVRETLARSSYQFEDSWAGIMPGLEEGGLAWVAANYLAGTFDVSRNGTTTDSSVGVIELGGGSVQVSFEVGPKAEVPPGDRYIFTTALGRKYSVYAHSYMRYGQDYAQAELQKRLPGGQDPCYPAGYKRPGEIAGSGDAAACQAHIQNHLLEPHPEAPGKLPGAPQISGSFVATENFFHVRSRLQLPMLASLEAMETAANATCASAFVPTEFELKKMEDGSSDPLQPAECFGLSYHIALLKALRAFTTEGVRLEITKQLAGSDIDWAIGAAVMHVLSTGEVSSISITATQDIYSVVLLSVAMISALVLVGLKRRKTL